MTQAFAAWLAEHGLAQVFITHAGDGFYANNEKKIGVLQRSGETGATSFYLNDVLEMELRDDENTLARWNTYAGWHTFPRSTRHSTNEVYLRFRLMNGVEYKMQIFRATHGNITRTSPEHINLCNYACQIAQIFLSHIQN